MTPSWFLKLSTRLHGRWNPNYPIYRGDSRLCTTYTIPEVCTRLASLALLVLVAHESRDPYMRDVWGIPRPDAIRACEASDPAGHYMSHLVGWVGEY
jgi:hypothetical protein